MTIYLLDTAAFLKAMTPPPVVHKPAHGGYPGMVLHEKGGRLIWVVKNQPGYPVDRFHLRGTETAFES